MNPNRPARLNRVLLAVIGLLLLVAGLFVVTTGTGLLTALPTALLGTATALPDRADALPVPAQLPVWVPWVTTAAAVLIGLLALRWLIAQTLRRPATGTWQLAPDTTAGATRIDSATAVVPLVEELRELPGVHDATARLSGPRQDPHLYLTVTAERGADLTDLRRRIDQDAVPRLVSALALPALPVELLLQLGSRDTARTT